MLYIRSSDFIHLTAENMYGLTNFSLFPLEVLLSFLFVSDIFLIRMLHTDWSFAFLSHSWFPCCIHMAEKGLRVQLGSSSRGVTGLGVRGLFPECYGVGSQDSGRVGNPEGSSKPSETRPWIIAVIANLIVNDDRPSTISVEIRACLWRQEEVEDK